MAGEYDQMVFNVGFATGLSLVYRYRNGSKDVPPIVSYLGAGLVFGSFAVTTKYLLDGENTMNYLLNGAANTNNTVVCGVMAIFAGNAAWNVYKGISDN